MGSLGLEPSPDLFVEHLIEIFKEVNRILRKDGTFFLNLGDSYAGGAGRWGGYDNMPECKQSTNRGSFGQVGKDVPSSLKPKDLCGIPWRTAFALQGFGVIPFLKFSEWADILKEAREKEDWELVLLCEGLLRKEDLLTRIQYEANWLRSDIIFHKKNPMPSSVRDRPTTSHEYIFMFTKSAKYFYDGDAIREGLAESTLADSRNATGRHTQDSDKYQVGVSGVPDQPSWYRGKTFVDPEHGRNARSVWTITMQGYSEAHFATFPPELPRRCIRTSPTKVCAKCGKGWERIVEKTEEVNPSAKGSKFDEGKTAEHELGRAQSGERYLNKTIDFRPSCSCYPKGREETSRAIILDPFAGSGTTGAVAVEEGRDYIMVELNPDYKKLIDKRIKKAQMGVTFDF